LLDLRGILKHDRAEIARGERAIDISFVTLRAKIRQIAAVINVRVTEDNGINSLWVEREMAVAIHRFIAATLEQSAFKQETFAVDFKKIHGTGCRPGRAEEMDSHGGNVLRVACSVKEMAKVATVVFSRNAADEICHGSTLKPRFTREKSHWTMALKPIKSFHQYEE
jgi:hypothetical protein